MQEKAVVLLIPPDGGESARLRERLEAEGHRVHLGQTLASLPTLLSEIKPEVAVIDAVTDLLGACDVLRAVRGEVEETAPCLIALVAEGQADAIHQVLDAGAADWLGWPARPRELLARIAIHVRLRRLHEMLGARLVESRALARQRDQMVAMVTHDMKSPLTSIFGHLRLLEDGAYGPLPGPEAKNALANAVRSTRRLISYIDDFLEIGHSLAGSLEMKQRAVAVRPLLEDVILNHGDAAREEGLTLTLEVEGELGEISGDEDKITRAIENLINNAIKYTDAGGHITLGARGHDEEVEIWVADTGRGIAPEDLAHIFEPFHRASGSERLARGTGLGLSVVRSIVETHGGRVEVQSTPGQGSRFTLHLPRRPGASHRRTALIVEDNTDFARIMALALRLEGVDSVICSSAEEAVRVLQDRRPDLITLDLMLPGMQGKQFVEDLVKQFGEGMAPVLALSASERRLEQLGELPIVRIRMHKDSFDQGTFRQAARELLEDR